MATHEFNVSQQAYSPGLPESLTLSPALTGTTDRLSGNAGYAPGAVSGRAPVTLQDKHAAPLSWNVQGGVYMSPPESLSEPIVQIDSVTKLHTSPSGTRAPFQSYIKADIAALPDGQPVKLLLAGAELKLHSEAATRVAAAMKTATERESNGLTTLCHDFTALAVAGRTLQEQAAGSILHFVPLPEIFASAHVMEMEHLISPLEAIMLIKVSDNGAYKVVHHLVKLTDNPPHLYMHKLEHEEIVVSDLKAAVDFYGAHSVGITKTMQLVSRRTGGLIEELSLTHDSLTQKYGYRYLPA